MAQGKLVDKAVLRTLVPPRALNSDNFDELASKALLEEVPPGTVLFRQGDHDRMAVYLIEGEVDLAGDEGHEVVRGGTEAARHPLAAFQPRRHTATTRTVCKLTRFDSDLLDILLTWDQLSGIEVAEIAGTEAQAAQPAEAGGDADWMTRILQSRAFMQVPPANIQAMFMRMEEVPVRAGDTVVRQGEDGDYYYIIKHGRAKVTRQAKTGSRITLAELVDGDAFGEEALLSDAKRNASVTMETDGSLMRLSKEDFDALLKEPMLTWLTRDEAERKVAQGARWLDVRLESEHAQSGIPGSVNIPLFMLRLKADSLDPSVPYVVYCDTGRRSSAAAFLLSERGFETYVLQGGVAGAAG